MPSSIAHISHRLRQLALTSSPTTALFYARLWHALITPTEGDHESLHILALCLLQSGQPYPALYHVRDLADADADGKGRKTIGCYGCAMIVGKCCTVLGRYSEGRPVVERASKRSTPTTLPTLCPASSAHLMMATLSHKGKAPEQAAESYTRALAEDPWCWEAFIGLCDIGAPPTAENLFPSPPPTRTSSQTSRPPTLSPNSMPRSSASEIPGIPPRRQLSPLAGGLFTPDGAPRIGMMGPSAWETPSNTTEHPSVPVQSRRPLPNLISSFIPSLPASFRSNSTVTPANPDPAPAKPPAMKRPRGGNVKKPVDGLPMRRNDRDLKSIEPNGEEIAPVRRSSRLKSGTKPKAPRATRSRSATSSASGATVEISSPPSQEIQSHADDWLRDIVRRCARAYRALSVYACQEAIDEIDGLPELTRFTWAIDIIARAHYEMANYVLARRAYEAVLKLEPYTLEGTELFSTLLWHLGDPPALSHLSQWLIAINREAPQPWIAAGNCFSLQKDHDEATRCFRRATQLDPGCAYAWTLCGYEAIEMEEFDRAIAFYRTAIRTDARHYNAWYGMGLVYLKTGKPKYAEHHFRRAAEINPTNAVLLCCIGMVLEQSDDVVQALSFYDQACKLAPDSSMVAYKRIRIMVALQRIDDAVKLLEPLVKTSPDEANIHFLLAKCYLKQGRRVDATIAFTAARELQPKLEGPIKIAMGGGDEEEGEE